MSSAQTNHLEALPSELRVQIFGYVLDYQHTLQRHITLTATSYRTETLSRLRSFFEQYDGVADGHQEDRATKRLRPSQTSLLGLNRRLNEEALDVLYASNRFRVSFNHLCVCQAKFPYTFDETRIRRLEIYDFLPRDIGSRTCELCTSSGLGLITYLTRLPRLREATVIFEDFGALPEFVQAAKIESLPLTGHEVGRFTVLRGGKQIQMQLPILTRAWHLLRQHGCLSVEEQQLPSTAVSRETGVAGMLEYLQWEANSYGRTSRALRPFFTDTGKGFAELQFSTPSEPTGRIVDFTVALADTLMDFLMTGEGDSIEVVAFEPQPSHFAPRWMFDQGVDELAPADNFETTGS